MNSADPDLDFSIIIPTYFRPRALCQCLESLTHLAASDITFEVIVVDDGSPSPPTSIIDEFSEALSLNFLQVPQAGPATARNTGGRVARGQHLLFLDDDCCIPPDFLIRSRKRTAPGSDPLIAGRSRLGESSGIFARTSQCIVNYLHEVFNAKADQPRFLTTNIFIIHREVFLASGGFDESFPLAGGEDREFGDRCVRQGHRMQYAPELEIEHDHAMDLKGFCRQQFHYGRGAYRFRRLISKRQCESLKLEPGRFYFDLVVFPLKEKWNAEHVMCSLLIALAQFMVLLGFLHEWFHFEKSELD